MRAIGMLTTIAFAAAAVAAGVLAYSSRGDIARYLKIRSM